MNLEIFYRYFARLMFIIASAAIGVAFLEWILGVFGLSIINELYRPRVILDIAAPLLIFVIAVLLRQIRDELRTGRGL